MLVQVVDFPKILKKSRADGIVWMTTFLSVIFIDIDYGLFIGIALSLTSVIIMGQKPKMVRLGRVPGTDIYLDFTRYHAAVELPGTCIVQIAGGLHFANKEYVGGKLQRLIAEREKGISSPLLKKIADERNNKELEAQEYEDVSAELLHQSPLQQIRFAILDMSSVCFVDPSSLKSMESLYEELKSKKIELCLAECSSQVYERMVNCDFFWRFPDRQLFAKVHDAVLFATQCYQPSGSVE